MRIWIAALLCTLLVFSPCALAEPGAAQIMAELARIDAATPLLAMAANATLHLKTDLTGKPDYGYAWDMIGQYLNGHIGHQEAPFTDAELAQVYAALFSEGAFTDIESQPCDPLRRVDGGYAYDFGDGEPWNVAVENAYRVQPDGSLLLDLSIYTDSNGGGQWFCFNASAVIVPDEGAPFGARLSQFVRSVAPLPVISEAVAQAGRDEHAAQAVLDGDLHTCWICDSGARGRTITLRFDSPEAVRGLALAPGCMKTPEMFDLCAKPAVVSIRMSNGATRAFDLRDIGLGHDCMVVLPFGEVETVTEIELTVDEVELGTEEQNVCISEIGVF